MVPQQYIGVTGITSVEDVENMRHGLSRADKNILGMYGILMDRDTLYERMYKGRWAKIEEVPELMRRMPENSLKTVHWCADQLKNYELLDVMKATNLECNALQLNMIYPSLDELKKFKRYFENVKIIFQIQKEMFENPLDMKKKMDPYKYLVDYVLIDQSMGAGVPIDPKVSRGVAEALRLFELGIVFAGGLDSKRVREIAPLIREFNTSIDAETRLMNDEDKLDNTKVSGYIAEALSVMDRTVV